MQVAGWMVATNATVHHRHVAGRNRDVCSGCTGLVDNQKSQSVHLIKVSQSNEDQFPLAIFMVDIFTSANSFRVRRMMICSERSHNPSQYLMYKNDWRPVCLFIPARGIHQS